MISIKELSKKLDKLKNIEENKKCFECEEKGTTYVCTNFGTFVCSRCAGLLRELNYKVKGTSVSIFNQKEIEFLEKNGNKIGKKIWMAKYKINIDEKPNSEDDDSLRIFLDKKYKFKKWYKKPKKNKEKNKTYEYEEGEESDTENENKIKINNYSNDNNSDDSEVESTDNKYDNNRKDRNNNYSLSSSSDEDNEKENKKNSKNKEEIKKGKEKIKKDDNKKLKNNIEKEKNYDKEEDEFKKVEENKNIDNNKNQSNNQRFEQDNYNLLEIFSSYNLKSNNSIDNINSFNTQQNYPQSKEFDFTNTDIPENKERIEYQNRINKLEDILKTLYANSNNNNLGYNMNYPIMVENNNICNMNYMNNFNNNNIQLNEYNNNFYHYQQATLNNAFTFI